MYYKIKIGLCLFILFLVNVLLGDQIKPNTSKLLARIKKTRFSRFYKLDIKCKKKKKIYKTSVIEKKNLDTQRRKLNSNLDGDKKKKMFVHRY